MRIIIIGGGLLVAGVWFGVCLVGWQDRPVIWLTALPAGLVASTLIAIYLHLPAIRHEREGHLTEIERLKTQAYHLQQERVPPAEREPLMVDAESERQYRWHRFWSDALEYAAENGFHYRNNFDRILRYEGWYGGLAMPFVRAGWLRPVAQAIRTEPAEGWNATRMLRELAAGKPPPYPEGEPPNFKQQTTKNTGIHSETVQFASEHK